MRTPRILTVGTANPPNRFTQAEVLTLAGYPDERRRGFFLHSGIEGRYLAIERGAFAPTESPSASWERTRPASALSSCAWEVASCWAARASSSRFPTPPSRRVWA